MVLYLIHEQHKWIKKIRRAIGGELEGEFEN